MSSHNYSTDDDLPNPEVWEQVVTTAPVDESALALPDQATDVDAEAANGPVSDRPPVPPGSQQPAADDVDPPGRNEAFNGAGSSNGNGAGSSNGNGAGSSNGNGAGFSNGNGAGFSNGDRSVNSVGSIDGLTSLNGLTSLTGVDTHGGLDALSAFNGSGAHHGTEMTNGSGLGADRELTNGSGPTGELTKPEPATAEVPMTPEPALDHDLHVDPADGEPANVAVVDRSHRAPARRLAHPHDFPAGDRGYGGDGPVDGAEWSPPTMSGGPGPEYEPQNRPSYQEQGPAPTHYGESTPGRYDPPPSNRRSPDTDEVPTSTPRAPHTSSSALISGGIGEAPVGDPVDQIAIRKLGGFNFMSVPQWMAVPRDEKARLIKGELVTFMYEGEEVSLRAALLFLQSLNRGHDEGRW